MSEQLALVLSVEVFLILTTIVLLAQPGFRVAERTHGTLRGIGYVLLCATFCWSVLLGCMVALQQASGL